MGYADDLRSVALNDVAVFGPLAQRGDDETRLDAKTLGLVRLGALVAMGATVPSYSAQVEYVISAGGTEDEIVGVLLAVAPVVGTPRAVAAAPALALGLGYDIAAALEACDESSD